ncbi:coiled-coil alpha-helical rod protein 1 isoform X2 [Strongylocentrotus purpuratus]|uniref:Coiled-coil alpha-helical rod protein 1 n=1 Tax=Strongylocentrotus purpuratus TaxID=7668 RepID=A0A7M7PMH3_STRPU|nr:coiled-coil alpha-helical rod protein 1 isoform X2 [Strongylocentrotus purpuratus]
MAGSLKNPAHFMKPLSSHGVGTPPYKLLPPSALTVPAKVAPKVTGVSGEPMAPKEDGKQSSLKPAHQTSPASQHEKETQVTLQPEAPAVIPQGATGTPLPSPSYSPYHHHHPPPQAPHLAQPYPPPPPPPPSHPGPDPHHLLELQRQTDMIVSRQAADIARLKTELSTQEAQHSGELARSRAGSRESRVGLEEEVLRLKQELKRCNASHKQQVSNMGEEHQRETIHLTEKMRKLTEDLHSVREESDGRNANLTTRLAAEQKSSSEQKDQLQNDVRQKQEEISRLTTQVAQQKAYIGDALPSSRTSAQWNIEKQNYDKKLKLLEEEKENIQTTADMLNVRLSSMQEIMAIQEKEMTQVQETQHDVTDKHPGEILLTKWREKVFALLVQRKSLEIVLKKDASTHGDKLHSLEGELDGSLNKVRILEHALADKEAQLQLEKKNVTKVEHELVSVQEVAGMLDSRLQESETCLCRMRDMVIRCHKYSNGLDMQSKEMVSRLNSHQQRLTFAISRIELLQDLLARKDSMLKLKVRGSSLQGYSDLSTQTDDQGLNPDSAVPMELKAELERLQKERDSLASRLKEDSAVFQQRIDDIREEMMEKTDKYEEENNQLRARVIDRGKEVESLEEQLSASDKSLTEAREETVRFRTDLARSQLVAEGASDEKCKLLESQHTERLAEMEKRLNEARREHAKAVVSLRQLERRHTREKERSSEALAAQEDYLTKEISKLKTRLSEVEADRNMLMVTLRQEGLLATCRAKQTGDIPSLIEKENGSCAGGDGERSDNHSISPTNHDRHPPDRGREPLHAVLKDLQTIAAKVLEDDDDDDEVEGNEE